MSRNLRYSEDELREQWAFIDSLVDSKAAALRSGTQDPEEDAAVTPTADAELLSELAVLRDRVRALESERASLLERLRAAGAAGVARATQATPPPPQRRFETRVRDWWRRLTR